ncbi:uncharacterized protein LOC135265741 [Tribolium castaneum]|uniref:Uncharacterized protein n=1 Tax=Tribolium castaneum TaxID=7070 RepID=A0A139WFC0_TRICA|nr:hypothetical protein TcasGA2_TC033572 [Tribolium castaneum]
MSGCRPLIFLAIVLTIFISVESSSSGSPCRPEKFNNYKELNDYLACVRMQATMRYGKRSPSLLLRRLQPDVFSDYDNDLPAISNNMLYGDN